MENDTKKDIFASAVSFALAFIVGRVWGDESFSIMVIVCIPTYCGIRYLQSKGLL
jgi:hypothetical protein|tara:strand:- start:8 stop:172 length:165 start_codon:yes stop_codon:yes gene_type:complete